MVMMFKVHSLLDISCQRQSHIHSKNKPNAIMSVVNKI